jgi:uncharacterized protein
MTISLYSVAKLSIFPRLNGLKLVLDQAEAFAAERKIDPSVLLNARLAPDMRSLTNQVQLASDHAKGAFFRTAGLEVPPLSDTESTFAELHARIDKTMELIEAIPADAMHGRDDAEIEIRFPFATMKFTGHDYLVGFALPNFYFHVTTAYDIVRHNGVTLGKSVFMGRAPG